MINCEKILEVSVEHMKNVFGEYDSYIKKIEKDFAVVIIDRNGSIYIQGDEIEAVQKASKIMEELIELSERGCVIQEQSVDYTIAMAMAITAFRNNEVGRIILTRPAIEAGEKLGFLQGDLQSKVDPYLRPLYDALYEIMGAESFVKNMEKGLIEVAPLAYMRGKDFG